MERTVEGGALMMISVSIKDMTVERKGVDGDNETWKSEFECSGPASPHRRKRPMSTRSQLAFAGASHHQILYSLNLNPYILET